MQSGHDAAKAKQPVPKWVPVVLLGISTVALSVPIVLLRRQRVAQALTKAPPPRRRAEPSQIPRASPTTAVPTARVEPIRAQAPKTPKAETLPDPGFNSALYSAKAFGVATTLVTVGAFIGVWAVQASLGVQNTEEFAMRMRKILMEKVPMLSSRIHRPPGSEDDDEAGQQVQMFLDGADPAWKWEDAEKRLTAAYDKDGFSGWAETALKELEAEGELERLRREHLMKGNKTT
ncbi:hypothetical protein BDM02DRAFT_3109402 [Thelephora ganbajun]|uniref:Uncharacterized protein n=1 Tax=Thelephora ganbajun TaxID=370292 RepID=A0ACB6ZTD6_THEGA|nr:hypothetical protein BDM02DRAFT_3109402 [Thelephora ganbajun]